MITEASPGNMGVAPPLPGFTRLKDACARNGALYISDEEQTDVPAGAGWYGIDGVRPDLMTSAR